MRSSRGRAARGRSFDTSASVRIDSAHDALSLLRDPSTWSSWQSEIDAAEGPAPLEPGDRVIGDATMLGFAVGGRADVVAAGDDVVEHDVIVGVRMNVRYSLARAGDGWILTHRLSAELPGGLSGRVLSVFLKRRLIRMQKRLLHDLTATIARSKRGPNPAKSVERSDPAN
jgi:hypothetical protein